MNTLAVFAFAFQLTGAEGEAKLCIVVYQLRKDFFMNEISRFFVCRMKNDMQDKCSSRCTWNNNKTRGLKRSECFSAKKQLSSRERPSLPCFLPFSLFPNSKLRRWPFLVNDDVNPSVCFSLLIVRPWARTKECLCYSRNLRIPSSAGLNLRLTAYFCSLQLRAN